MLKQPISVTCAKGIPPFLSEEIKSLGYPVLSTQEAAVETEGTLLDAMRMNLHLRTAHRILWQVGGFTARNPNDLYDKVYKIPWEMFLYDDGYFSVNTSVDHPSINDSRFVSLKTKDAIADRFQAKAGRRPDSGSDKDRAVIFVHWHGDRCRVYLDTSGEPLSKRGYRKIPMNAPMQETLAAACVLASKWTGNSNFVNPMCGSGTLAIEAALIGLNKAPGLLRTNFGFMHLRPFQQREWRAMREEAIAAERKTLGGKIIATDIHAEAVKSAKLNARDANVGDFIEFNVCDFRETTVPTDGGVIMFNPEYGERMGDVEKLEGTYKAIGDFLKQKCAGYMGYVLTANAHLSRKVGLHSKRRIILFNSNLECRLLEFELYAGTRRS